MKRIRLTTAQALVRFLDNQYVQVDGAQSKFVRGVFGIFGHGNVVGIGEALAAGGHGLTYFQGHNEQGMAHAAVGYAKQMRRRQIIAVTSSIGPGALNMVTAAATATVNRIPLLVLPGDTFACRQPDPVLQQLEQFNDLGITANDAFRPVSRAWDRISRPEQLLSACINAMRVLTDPAETGAVTLALPQDVQGESYEFPVEFFDRRVHRIERRPPTEAEVEEAARLVTSSRRPLIICGGGVRYSDAGAALASFCETLGIPFGETQAGKGEVPWDNPYNLGGIGVTGTQAANALAKSADLVIALGTRLSDFTTSSKWLFQDPRSRLLGINTNSFDAHKMNGASVIADARLALEALGAALKKSGYKSQWGTEIQSARKEWNAEVDKLYCAEDPAGLSQIRCLGELNERLLPKDAIVVAASGSLPGDMQRLWRPRASDTYHMEYGFSCMGYEIGAALGAKLACPEREVFALVGDGSYVMLHSEIIASLQERAKINVLVFDNGGFQVIDNLQVAQGIERFGNEWRQRDHASGRLTGPFLPIDFAANGESYGARGFRARTVEEFRAAIKGALAEKRTTVIDAKVTAKSMTHGYGSWWRVGTAEVSQNPAVEKAAREIHEESAKARAY